MISCRKWQIFGFMAMGVLFLAIGLFANGDDEALDTDTAVIALYYISLFVTHCSARITTFMFPAELFPTAIRCLCCGMASGFGKIGAAAGAMFYHYFSSWFSVKA